MQILQIGSPISLYVRSNSSPFHWPSAYMTSARLETPFWSRNNQQAFVSGTLSPLQTQSLQGHHFYHPHKRPESHTVPSQHHSSTPQILPSSQESMPVAKHVSLEMAISCQKTVQSSTKPHKPYESTTHSRKYFYLSTSPLIHILQASGILYESRISLHIDPWTDSIVSINLQNPGTLIP